MTKTFHLDIVTAETRIFTGAVEKVFVTGVEGDLEVLYNHAPLLTALAPGPVWAVANGREEGFVIFGGTLEVQPNMTIILADTALRASDLDEAAAEAAKRQAEHMMHKREANINYAKARSDLVQAVAQLRAIRQMKDLHK